MNYARFAATETRSRQTMIQPCACATSALKLKQTNKAQTVAEPKNFMDRWSDVINRRRIAREEIEDPRDAEIARLRTALKAIIDMIVYCPDGPKNADSLPGCIRATAEQALNQS